MSEIYNLLDLEMVGSRTEKRERERERSLPEDLSEYNEAQTGPAPL